MPFPSESFPPIHLLDGGLGTTLTDGHGCAFNDSTPLWSSQLLLTSPTTLLSAQASFARAGADIILTATYQASFEGFAKSGVSEDDAGKSMRSAVSIARAAFGANGDREAGRAREGKVALSLGAYGATMIPSQEYSGEYDELHVTVKQLRDWHFRRIRAFFPVTEGFEESGIGNGMEEKKTCWGEVDFVAFETLPLLREILAVREVMCAVAKLANGEEKGFWISCVFPGEENCLPDGSIVKEVVRAMLGKREGARTPMGVGINCTNIEKVEGLIGEFESAMKELVENGEVKEWPSLVVYPDGTNGEVYNTTTKEWETQEESGANSVSPCGDLQCRTSMC
jgi:homocysteine S-methyltransferase